MFSLWRLKSCVDCEKIIPRWDVLCLRCPTEWDQRPLGRCRRRWLMCLKLTLRALCSLISLSSHVLRLRTPAWHAVMTLTSTALPFSLVPCQPWKLIFAQVVPQSSFVTHAVTPSSCAVADFLSSVCLILKLFDSKNGHEYLTMKGILQWDDIVWMCLT